MPITENPSSRRKGTLLSWIRGGSREGAREDGTRGGGADGFAMGDARPFTLRRTPSRADDQDAARPGPFVPSPLDGLSDGEFLAHIQREIARLEGVNRELCEQLAERNAALEALRESETRYRMLVHTAPMALIETDPVGSVTYANPAAAVLLGVQETDVVGAPIWYTAASDFVRDTLRELFLARGRVRDTQVQPLTLVQLRRGDGSLRNVEIAHEWKTDGRDRIIGSLARLLDVTDRILDEAELKASAGVYRDLFENAPAMLLTVDAKTTTILECNRAVLEETGYTRAEILDRSIFDLYDPGCIEEAAANFSDLLHTGELRDVEVRVRRKSGQFVRVLETLSTVADPGGPVLACRTAWHPLDRPPRRPGSTGSKRSV